MLFNPDALAQAWQLFFSPDTFLWMAIGLLAGEVFGAIPGITVIMGMALLLPYTLALPVAPAMAMLIGIYKGADYGGSISAITFGVPGTPGASATLMDGYKLTLRGQGRKALEISLYASVLGELLADILTVVVAPLVAGVALAFGPSERFWLTAVAMVLIGAVVGRSLAKGLISITLGFLLGMIGCDPIGGVPRMTFGLWWLSGGIPLIPLVLGTIALPLILNESRSCFGRGGTAKRAKESTSQGIWKEAGLSFKEFMQCWKEIILIGFPLGSLVGFLPGLGSTVAAFASWGTAKQVSPKKRIGEGRLEGVAACEAANSAVIGPCFIPLFAFGIPGSAGAALVGAALMMQGASPSARMFEIYPHIIYSFFMTLIACGLLNLLIGKFLVRVFAVAAHVPKPILIPLVLMFATIGCYTYRSNPYDIILMVVFTMLGFGMLLLDIPSFPVVIGVMLSPLLESNLRLALLLHHGEWVQTLFSSPLSVGMIVGVITLVFFAVRLFQKREG